MSPDLLSSESVKLEVDLLSLSESDLAEAMLVLGLLAEYPAHFLQLSVRYHNREICSKLA